MAKNHPCLSCPTHQSGADKKSAPECAGCELVDGYDREIRESQPTNVSEIKAGRNIKTCSVEGCDGLYLAKGYCSKHYWKMKRPADPEKKEAMKRARKGTAPPDNTQKGVATIKHGGSRLIDLNNSLFSQLDRLLDKTLTGPALEAEINRSKAVSNCATQIINNAKLVLDAHKSINEGMINTAPEMFGMKVLIDAK